MPLATEGSPADDRSLLRGGAGHEPFPAPEAAGSIGARFATIATRYPDRPAIVGREGVVSYGELDGRTGSIAGMIGDARPSVALLLDQGIDYVVGLVAALRTGAMVVPLDPAYPDAILTALLEHAQAAAILAQPSTRELACRVAGSRPVVDVAAPPPGAFRDPQIASHAPAVLFYTSGTTGNPKGVVDLHANVLDNTRRYVDSLRIGSGDRLSLVHGPMFSGLVSSLCSALLTGAAVIPLDVRRQGLERLGEELATAGATMLHLVPSVYRRLLQSPTSWRDVRVVRLEGDAATWADVGRAAGRFAGDVLVVNGLGATETGLVAQCFARPDAVADDHGPMPVGHSVPGIEVTVIDDDVRRVPAGESGELVVHGRHLALGYWRDDARTAAAFTRDAADPGRRSYRTGDLATLDPRVGLRLIGRRDGVHKVRGQAVDPLLVEQRLRALPGVSDAAAITRGDAGAEARLVGYVAADEPLDAASLRRTLAQDLPGPLVPSAIVVLPALPLTSAGKVDRAALPAPDHARPSLDVPYVAPRDPLEERLAEIWADVLELGPVGIDDGFFDLGGDSLGAMTMLLEVGRWLGRDVPSDVLARAATVSELAIQLRDRPPDDDGEAVRLSAGPGPRVFLIHAVGGNPFVFRSVARAVGDDATVISIQPPDVAASSAYEPVAVKAARYARRVTELQPYGPYHLVGWCFGGLVAHELACQLVDAGYPVGTLTLVGVGPLEFPTQVSPAAGRRFTRSRWRARLRLVAETYGRHSPGAATRAIGRRAGRFVRRGFAVTAARSGVEPLEPLDHRREAWDFSTMTAVAAARHRARAFPGPLQVIVGREAERWFLGDPDVDLARLALGRVDVTVLPDEGPAILDMPGAARLGALLRDRIDGRGPT